MIRLFFTAKNRKYSLSIEKGQDILLALDNFIKNNKLELTRLKNIKISSPGSSDSVSGRIGKIIAFVLDKA